MVDPYEIPADLHHIFLHADELEGRFGGLCFFRLPVRPEVAARVPEHLLSRTEAGVPIMMVCDPAGQTGVDLLLRDMQRAGVRHMSGTSMNRSGTREIVDQEAGIEFARAAGVPLFLTDGMGTGRVLGSPTIFTVDRSGVKLIRDSYLPWRVFEPLFGMPIDASETRPANWPQLDPRVSARDPRALRRALLDFVQREASAHHLRDAALVGSSVLAETLFGWTGRSRTSGVVRVGRQSRVARQGAPSTPAGIESPLRREPDQVAA
jgi:hypothetical protein